jgi:hypothetical protein
MPFIVDKLILENRDSNRIFHNQSLSVFTFNELVETIAAINNMINKGKKAAGCINEEPRSKLLGIKDCTLKSFRMVGEQIPHAPSFPQQAVGY